MRKTWYVSRITALLVGCLAFSQIGIAQRGPRQFTQKIRLAGTSPGAEVSDWYPGLFHLKVYPAVDDAGHIENWVWWEFGDTDSGLHTWGYGRLPDQYIAVSGFDSLKLSIPDLTLLEGGFVSAEYCTWDGGCQPTTPPPAPVYGTWSVLWPWGYSYTEVTTGTVETKEEYVGSVHDSRQSGRWESNAACFEGTIADMEIRCRRIHKNGSMYVYRGVTVEQSWYEEEYP